MKRWQKKKFVFGALRPRLLQIKIAMQQLNAEVISTDSAIYWCAEAHCVSTLMSHQIHRNPIRKHTRVDLYCVQKRNVCGQGTYQLIVDKTAQETNLYDLHRTSSVNTSSIVELKIMILMIMINVKVTINVMIIVMVTG